MHLSNESHWKSAAVSHSGNGLPNNRSCSNSLHLRLFSLHCSLYLHQDLWVKRAHCGCGGLIISLHNIIADKLADLGGDRHLERVYPGPTGSSRNSESPCSSGKKLRLCGLILGVSRHAAVSPHAIINYCNNPSQILSWPDKCWTFSLNIWSVELLKRRNDSVRMERVLENQHATF